MAMALQDSQHAPAEGQAKLTSGQQPMTCLLPDDTPAELLQLQPQEAAGPATPAWTEEQHGTAGPNLCYSPHSTTESDYMWMRLQQRAEGLVLDGSLLPQQLRQCQECWLQQRQQRQRLALATPRRSLSFVQKQVAEAVQSLPSPSSLVAAGSPLDDMDVDLRDVVAQSGDLAAAGAAA